MAFWENKEITAKLEKCEASLKTLQESTASIQKQLQAFANKEELKVLASKEGLLALSKQLEEVKKTTPEYEAQAKESAEKAYAHLEDAAKILEEGRTVWDEINETKDTLIALKNETQQFAAAFKQEHANIESNIAILKTQEQTLIDSIESVRTKISTIQEVFEKHPDINAEIENIERFLTQIEDVNGKSLQLLKNITSRKNEIDRLHNEIIGFKQEDSETHEETYVPGIKDDLQKAYEGLDEKLEELATHIKSLDETANSRYNTFFQQTNEEKHKAFDRWEGNFEALKSRIETLLPNALTAGLSYAFSDKKREEEKAYNTHKWQFVFGIIGMVGVSCIPFVVSYNFLMEGLKLVEVIDKIPRVVLAILPLYVPVLWLTISGSKKMNLSKRLIEEYSHKEVLSKTFEGLSSQIEKIGNENISADLRLALLDNFLEMYSQNPGRLISDYNNTDHPLMELLENANKLENSVERINKIPGMKKIAKILERKATDKITQATERVEKSIDKAIELTDTVTNGEV